MANRHRVEHDGQVFTRNSAGRVYRYAVLGPVSLADNLARAEKSARYSWKQNQDYHREYVDGTSRFLATPEWARTDEQKRAHIAEGERQIQASKDWLALGEAGLIADYQRRAELEWRHRFPERDAGWSCRGWCSRLDLAQKLADPGDAIVAAVLL
jgi:hypothetical protein